MAPPSVSKMKEAGLLLFSLKSVVPLRIWPVGLGTVTTRALTVIGVIDPSSCVRSPAYKVEVLVCWLETQNGLVALNEMPHGFSRFASIFSGAPPTGLAMSETRFVWWNTATLALL